IVRITRLTVRNYRSFGSDTVTWDVPDIPQPLSIIGSNNAGKSNLVRALLHCLAARSSTPSSFASHDFHRADLSREIRVCVEVAPPLQSTNAYNKITAMPLLDLRVIDEGGGIEVTHYCCDDNGKPVFNAR